MAARSMWRRPRSRWREVARARAVVLALALAAPAAAEPLPIAPAERRSGITFAGPQTRGLQADDTANPGMLFVLDGAQLWQAPAGKAQRACSDCHGAAEQNMRGVAARYPAFDDASGAALDLSGRINACRARHQGAPRLGSEEPSLLALAAFVGFQSRGLPLAPPQDPPMASARGAGRRLYETRMGQLRLSCADCHDALWAHRLGGSPITQGQPGAYPIYRLEWQGLGSLQRRMRACMTGVRAEPFDDGAPEFIALEAYLAGRGAGLPVETPGVRP